MLKKAFQLHRSLIYLAISGLLLFSVSALMHPLMVWTGPQSKQFRAPGFTLNANTLDLFTKSQAFRNNRITNSKVTKVVATEIGPVLQVTQAEDKPRRYFDLKSGTELDDFDQKQAIWLARYYTKETENIKSIEFITEFNPQYPSVNRLLPVYKVNFETDENLSAYVHTETGALGALNNDWKAALQAGFRLLHTFSWLDEFPVVRVAILAVLLVALTVAAITGIVMLIRIRRRKYQSNKQRIHRMLAGVVAIPLLGFSISGTYHLIQNEVSTPPSGLRLSPVVALNGLSFHDLTLSVFTLNDLPPSSPLAELESFIVENKEINSLSLVNYKGNPVWRISYSTPSSNKTASEAEVRSARFKGQPQEQSSLLIPIHSKDNLILNDKQFVSELAKNYLTDIYNYSIESSQLSTPTLVTRFGNGYDFRNKRLPVYKVESNQEDTLFIDPITGVLADKISNARKLEGWSFSMLHKWNFTQVVLNRFQRDLLIVLIILATIATGVIGFSMKRKSA